MYLPRAIRSSASRPLMTPSQRQELADPLNRGLSRLPRMRRFPCLQAERKWKGELRAHHHEHACVTDTLKALAAKRESVARELRGALGVAERELEKAVSAGQESERRACEMAEQRDSALARVRELESQAEAQRAEREKEAQELGAIVAALRCPHPSARLRHSHFPFAQAPPAEACSVPRPPLRSIPWSVKWPPDGISPLSAPERRPKRFLQV